MLRLLGAFRGQLANRFRLLPDTPNGWSVLMETLETIEPKPYLALDLEKIRNENYSRIVIPDDLDAEALEIFLEKHLIIPAKGKNQPANDVLLRWLAALALPPNLYFDWVILAGQKIGRSNENPLTIENLKNKLEIEEKQRQNETDQLQNQIDKLNSDLGLIFL